MKENTEKCPDLTEHICDWGNKYNVILIHQPLALTRVTSALLHSEGKHTKKAIDGI